MHLFYRHHTTLQDKQTGELNAGVFEARNSDHKNALHHVVDLIILQYMKN